MTDIAKLHENILRIITIEEIKKLKARYFCCLDHKDWEGWRNKVFCADAVLDVQEARAEPYIGMAAILEMIQTNLTGVLTIHHGHMPIIEITSPTTATGYGHWRMFCFGRMEGGSMALTAASMGTGITTRYMSAINRMAYQNLAPDAFVATGSA